jgi:hypothetical protein
MACLAPALHSHSRPVVHNTPFPHGLVYAQAGVHIGNDTTKVTQKDTICTTPETHPPWMIYSLNSVAWSSPLSDSARPAHEAVPNAHITPPCITNQAHFTVGLFPHASRGPPKVASMGGLASNDIAVTRVSNCSHISGMDGV